VRGKGVRRPDGTYGDLLVTVELMVPKNVSTKGRKALEDLREATAGEDPREELLLRARGA
jgi:molecular chaperone DnaJ